MSTETRSAKRSASSRVDPMDLAGIDDVLSDEEKAIRGAVRHLCDEHVDPFVADWFESGQMPQIRELAQEMGALGLLGMHLEGYGCAGMSAVDY
ncbi:MAG: acyl-CoA dehydrogenase family protein, partial [Ornithinimicrobium sp.]